MRIMMLGFAHYTALSRPMSWLINQGHEVMLVDSVNRYPKAPENYHFFSFGLTNDSLLPYRLLGEKQGERLKIETGAKLLAVAAQRFQPDVIHAHFINWQTECAVRLKHPLMVSVWGTLNSELYAPERAEPTVRKELVFKGTTGFILESPFLVERSQILAPSVPHHFHIPMALDPDLFHGGYKSHRTAWRMVLKIPDEAFVFLSPRGLDPGYNHHHILEAFANALPHLKTPAFLLLVKLGRSGSIKTKMAYEKYLQQRITELGIAKNVRWVPSQEFETMPALYALADAVVSYPNRDAFPSTLIEAAACERLIISCTLPTYQGTFVERCGLLVEREQPSALAQTMIKVANAGPSAYQAQLREARRIIEREYNEDLLGERLVAAYQTIAK